jgi:hypothetical protein
MTDGELFGGCNHTTVRHPAHRISCVSAATSTARSPNRFRLSALNGACGCMESRNLFGFPAFYRQGANDAANRPSRGCTHIPVALESNPGAVALHSDYENRQQTDSDWPTNGRLTTECDRPTGAGSAKAGQRISNLYRSGASGFAMGEIFSTRWSHIA